MKITKHLPYYIDTIFYVVMLPLIVLLVPTQRWYQSSPLFVLLLILYFYGVYFLNKKWCIPAFVDKRNRRKTMLLIGVMILTTYLITQFLPYLFNDSGEVAENIRVSKRFEVRTRYIWLIFFIVMGFAYTVGLLTELFNQIVIGRELEVEKDKAELTLCKSQVNPQFLFNTSKVIQSLLSQKSTDVEEVFVKFSDVLKYMYSKAGHDLVDIGGEVACIEDYLDLQRLQVGDNIAIDFATDIRSTQVQIPPFALYTFVENTIKHGVSQCEKSKIIVSIIEQEGVITLQTENKIFKRERSLAKGNSIANIRKRLNFHYPQAHSLLIENDGKHHKVTLSLNV